MKTASRQSERPADDGAAELGIPGFLQPMRLSNESEDADITLRPAREVLENPRFPAVRERQIRETLRVYGVTVFPGRFSVDAWRVILIGQILGMAGQDIDGGSTATPTELKRRMSFYGLFSARQIDVYLNRLVETGYLDVAVNPADRRMRLLRPLPPLMDWYWSYLDLYYHSCQALFPERSFDLVTRQEADFAPFLARVGADARSMATAMQILGRDPSLAAFFSRGSATVLLYAALHTEASRPEHIMREADLLAYSGEFGRSRSHVRNLIALAIEHGFIEEIGPRRQTLRVTDRLRTTMDHFMADTIRSSEVSYRRAERQYLASRAAG